MKAAGVAVSAALLGLIIKKFNPELSGLISICAISLIIIAALGFAQQLKELIAGAERLTEISDIYIISVFKCLAISIVSKLASDICKDAGQAALASSVELAGCMCAAMIVLPLVVNMINLIGSMV